MTKEELIGRKFITNVGEVFVISDYDNPATVYIKKDVVSVKKPTSYPLDILINYINKGEWKLLPEKKITMYKTSKGIEYGVGTQFKNTTVSDNAGVFKIDEISNNYEVVKYTRLDTNTAYNCSVRELNNNLDSDWWAITNDIIMKDYKQVDPKTIKFDFTNKYIKTNNKEEYDWVVEVAGYNKYKYSGGVSVNYLKDQREQMHFGYTGYNLIGYSPNSFELSADKHFKEITIQDILNNMKEVIEVGDICTHSHGTAGCTYTITAVKGDGGCRATKSDDTREGNYLLEFMTLVSKGKKKEIIGYETVVDLPGIPKGSVTQPSISMDYKFGSDASGATLYFTKNKLSDTKFFKPIYKSDSIEIKFSKYTATLSKDNGLVFSDGEKLDYKSVKDTITSLSKTTVKIDSKGGFDISFQFTVSSVKVGCKSFTGDDVKLISEAIKKLEA